MEDKLQSVVKKEQLAIETSKLDDKMVNQQIASRLTRGNLLIGRRGEDELPTNNNQRGRASADKKKDNNKDKSDDEYRQEGEDDDADEEDYVTSTEVAAKDDDAVERGARRAPPVHSERLPLPWTGRLGYVRHRTKHRQIGHSSFLSQECRSESPA